MRKCIDIWGSHLPHPYIAIRGLLYGDCQIDARVANVATHDPGKGCPADFVAGPLLYQVDQPTGRHFVFDQVVNDQHVRYIHCMVQIRKGPSEAAIHSAVARYLSAVLHKSVLWFHIPNGEQRSLITAKRLKGMGVRAGMPDLCLMWSDPDTKQPIVGWIELKSAKGRLSESQLLMTAQLMELHHHVAIARSVDDVAAHLGWWNVPMKKSKLV